MPISSSTTLLLLLVLLSLTTLVHAQADGAGAPQAAGQNAVGATEPGHGVPIIAGTEIAGVTYVDAGGLASALGDVVTAAGGVLTWRGDQGVATFFLGSADALLQQPLTGGPDDWALSAPPLLKAGSSGVDPAGWLLPLDAVQLLGVAATQLDEQVYSLHLPSGAVVRLALGSGAAPADVDAVAWSREAGDGNEVTAVGGVPALRFFADEDLSLLLIDLDMAPLAFPELTAVVDEAAARAGGDHALLALVTALRQRDWSASLVFEQDDLSLEVRSPYRFHLYLGSAVAVSPDAPVAAVILLPQTFSLYKPIAVSWAGQTATVTFRR
ncbi:MAG TPA: hypothetical protein VKZ43_05725 [Trueperaceae bacterium]|nr:hypothetical protein [Trueperaceae bacterium]